MVGHANAKALVDTLPLGHEGFDDPGVPRCRTSTQCFGSPTVTGRVSHHPLSYLDLTLTDGGGGTLSSNMCKVALLTHTGGEGVKWLVKGILHKCQKPHPLSES